MSDRLVTEVPKDIGVLSEPIKFPKSGLVASNRTLKAAMTERLCSYDADEPTKRGVPGPELIRVYEEWGKGGVSSTRSCATEPDSKPMLISAPLLATRASQFGLILSGNTFGDYINLEAKGNPIMVGDEPERLENFKKVAAAAKAEGALYIIQLSHGGRQVPYDVNPNPVSSSDVRLDKMSGNDVSSMFGQPTQLTVEEIKKVVDNFAKAAAYAHKTGADGVQLHSAHG